MTSRVLELLGPQGELARRLPGYEPRAGQVSMGQAVERALAEEHVLVCEAGTGTGKTLAYLLPAVLSGKRVVISTATRALQDQILGHDLPILRDRLGLTLSVAVMKGLGNYLCLRRWERFQGSQQPRDLAAALRLQHVERWVQATATGDVAELDDIPEQDPLWSEITSGSDTRLGAGCAHHEQCFVTAMRARAEAARIVIVNHHLFFADLALRGPHPGHVLPDYDAVIFDEAHQIEDVATDFFGVRVTNARIARLIGETERNLTQATRLELADARVWPRMMQRLRLASDNFWNRLVGQLGQGRTPLVPDFWLGPCREAWLELDAALEFVQLDTKALAGNLTGVSGSSVGTLIDALELDSRRAQQLRDHLAEIIEGRPHHVSWAEVAGRQQSLSSSPVEMSDLLRERVFDRVPTVVLTSATLATEATRHGATNKPFAYFERRVGLEGTTAHVEELIVPSPFDYASQALLYTPEDLPEPSAPSFLDAVANRSAELIELTGGGAFVLTTSNRSLGILARELRARLPGHCVLVQGEAPRTALLEEFREETDAVLVATLGFWEGVDVPGDSLRLVILEKVPFAVPSDPVLAARAAALEEAGLNAFAHLQVPAAIITLKQGFGRLIRRRGDLGIVALLDVRVRRKSYGRRLLSALPPARQLTRWEDVSRHWRQLLATRAAGGVGRDESDEAEVSGRGESESSSLTARVTMEGRRSS